MHLNKESPAPRYWKPVVVAICLAVGGIHFVTGPQYGGPLPGFVNGYLIDILLPFAMYLLLGVQKITLLHGRLLRALLVLGVGVLTETLQYFGVPIFGRTFDPLDFAMFAIGVLAANLLERVILSDPLS
ncbi:MAG: hypothetical protein HKN37_08240 [Rhodothermales bacterium]|nr:hypothetical protein [Rhodothermales bacterium]